jgi:ferritin-like metal-binding protein YciE
VKYSNLEDGFTYGHQKPTKKTYLFLAKKLEKISNQNLEETEKIKIKIIRGDEIILMLKNQQILDAGIIAALFLWISDI